MNAIDGIFYGMCIFKIFKLLLYYTTHNPRYFAFNMQTLATGNFILFMSIYSIEKLNKELIDTNYFCMINKGWIIIIYSLN